MLDEFPQVLLILVSLFSFSVFRDFSLRRSNSNWDRHAVSRIILLRDGAFLARSGARFPLLFSHNPWMPQIFSYPNTTTPEAFSFVLPSLGVNLWSHRAREESGSARVTALNGTEKSMKNVNVIEKQHSSMTHSKRKLNEMASHRWRAEHFQLQENAHEWIALTIVELFCSAFSSMFSKLSFLDARVSGDKIF